MSDRKILIVESVLALVAILLLFASSAVYSKEPDAGVTESLTFMADLPAPPVAAVHWGRDPFVPLINGAGTAKVKLTAIFFNELSPSAIINGDIVYKESIVGGQKVVDIGKTHVILQGISGRIILEIASLSKLPATSEHPVSPVYEKAHETGQ